MTDHLPECYDALIPDFHNERWVCICPSLRACEQRVRKEALQDAKARESNGITWAQAYSAGLDAAREAVNGLPVYDDHGALKPFKPDTAVVYVMDALAAIDALKQGEQ